jgi:outer membrane protein TolC
MRGRGRGGVVALAAAGLCPALGAVLGVGLWAGPAHAMDLEEVRDRATRQAISVEQARARRDAADGRAWMATAENLPAVVGFVSGGTGAGFTAFGFPRPVQSQLGAGLRGTWALLSPADWGAASAARQTAAGQAALLDWAVVEARRDGTSAFVAAAASAEVHAALEQAFADAMRAEIAVAGQVEAGLRPPADGARAKAERAALEADLATAGWQRRARCGELLALLREDPTGSCDLNPGDVPAAAAGPSAHPALLAARATLSAARSEVHAATGALAPRLDASAGTAWYATSAGSGGPGWSAALDLTVPLVASGAGAASRSAERAEATLAELALEDQERGLRVALATAEARLDAARVGLSARERAREAAAAGLTLVEQRYHNGLAPLTDWIDARRQRDAAAVALARARAELGAAVAELEAARGVGR